MTVRTFAIPVTTEAKELCAADPKRKSLKVFNLSSNTVFILSAQNQTPSDGYPVVSALPYESKEPTARLWIIASTGTNDVRVEVISE